MQTAHALSKTVIKSCCCGVVHCERTEHHTSEFSPSIKQALLEYKRTTKIFDFSHFSVNKRNNKQNNTIESRMKCTVYDSKERYAWKATDADANISIGSHVLVQCFWFFGVDWFRPATSERSHKFNGLSAGQLLSQEKTLEKKVNFSILFFFRRDDAMTALFT